ncbi:MAG: hypothetical protein WDO74_16425 [Pseudomonadota bacterium]
MAIEPAFPVRPATYVAVEPPFRRGPATYVAVEPPFRHGRADGVAIERPIPARPRGWGGHRTANSGTAADMRGYRTAYSGEPGRA